MADVSKTVAIIFEGQNNTASALNGVEAGLKGIEQSAGGAGDKLRKATEEADKLAKTGGTLETALKGAFSAISVSLVISAFIDANVAAEKFEKTMTTLKGSSSAAAQELEYVRGVANKLGVDVGGAANAYVSLTAATKGTALEGAATRDIFEAVAKAMSALGKSSYETEGALLAISQMVSKGTVSMEELRGQLGERLPGAFKIAADAMGLSTQELDKLVSSGKLAATDFLPKFASALDKAFDGSKFDGYTNGMARLRNAISEAFVLIGDVGAFDILKTGVEASGKGVASLVGALEYFGGVFSATKKLFQTGDLEAFNADLRKVETQFNLTADKITGVTNQSEAETKRLARQAAEAGEQMGTALGKSAELSGEAWKKAAADIDKALKTLGIDPKIFVDPLQEMEAAFKSLATNAAATGEQIIVGLTGALQKLPQDANLDEFRRQIAYAFRDGKISAEEYAQALALIETKQANLSPSFGPASEAAKQQAEQFEKNAKAAEKAAEKAQQYQLEMEKLASNERIKLIESAVKLDIANVEANAKTVIAAFDSINNTVSDTGDLIGSLFGLFKDSNLSFTALSDIREQIDLENRRRDEALKLQKELITAQINQMKAQTSALEKSEGLIKIDGAGLKPHLEAFMWEILRAIQVRVNSDGLKMLLGV